MNTNYMNIFVLGAGASVDYRLPVWSELKELLTEHFKEDRGGTISPEKSNRYLEELEEIGPSRRYATVDEMISTISDKTADSTETSAEIFKGVKTIFEQRVRSEEVGWIETFVKNNDLENLLNNETSNHPSVFINFNYDTLFLMKIVEFFKEINESTPNPKKAAWRKKTGFNFENKFEMCARDIFHPYGILNLFDNDRIKVGKETFCYPTTKTYINARIIPDQRVKAWKSGGDNAISCHDADDKFTFVDIKARIRALGGGREGNVDTRLVVLGVGPISLEFNLKKIFDGQRFQVKQVHYTCMEEDEKHIYEAYFGKFQATTVRYKNCKELVEENTFIPFE